MPLLATVVVIIVIGAAFGYYYETASSNISSLNGQVTSLSGRVSYLNGQVISLNGQVSTLNLNITAQDSARLALRASLNMASTTIASLTNEAGSLSIEISSQSSQVDSLSGQISSESSQIASVSSVAYLKVEQILVNNQNYNMPVNSNTTVASFSVPLNTGGYLQISGTSSTYLLLLVCYGSTSQFQCESSITSYYLFYFGYGGATFNAPLMPGPIWIMAFNSLAGTATLTVNEWT
jgi:hypothetical protein